MVCYSFLDKHSFTFSRACTYKIFRVSLLWAEWEREKEREMRDRRPWWVRWSRRRVSPFFGCQSGRNGSALSVHKLHKDAGPLPFQPPSSFPLPPPHPTPPTTQKQQPTTRHQRRRIGRKASGPRTRRSTRFSPAHRFSFVICQKCKLGWAQTTTKGPNLQINNVWIFRWMADASAFCSIHSKHQALFYSLLIENRSFTKWCHISHWANINSRL